MSGYSWTVPPGTSSASGVTAAADLATVKARDIYFDGDLHVTPDGDWMTVEGVEAMRQAIYRRLMTSPGEFAFRPDYGIGVPDYVKEESSQSTLDELASKIKGQLLRDRRIEAVSVALKFADDVLIVTIAARINGKTLNFEPFQFSSTRT